MDFSVIQDQLFKAVETIFEGKIKEIPIDKCLECIVVSETQQENGSYKVTYKDVTMEAYPISNQAYNLNDIVYVMAIGGDLSKKKLILSAKNTNGQKFIDLSNVIPAVGRNFLEKSYIDRTFILKGEESISLEMSNDFIKEINGQTDIVISATVESNLTPIVGGTYGISLVLEYEDGEQKEYELTLNEIIGDPYKAIGYQHTIEKLEEKSIKRVVSLRVFISGFEPLLIEEYVKFDKVKVSFVEQAVANIAEQIPITLKIATTRGLTFKNKLGSTTLSAHLYKGKDEVFVSGVNRKYKWTRKDIEENIINFPTGEENINSSSIIVFAKNVENINTYMVEVLENEVATMSEEISLVNVNDGETADALDWIKDWDDNKVQINDTSILSPKMFAGENKGTSSEPNLTGIAIGRDILGGTDETIGIVAYSENEPTIQLKTDGSAIFGREEGRQLIVNTDGSIIVPKITIQDIDDNLGKDIDLSKNVGLNSMLYYSNGSNLRINSSPKLAAYVGITTVENSNLSVTLTVYGKATAECTLTVKIEMDNKEIPFKPKHRIFAGDNTIGIPFAIPQVTKAAHYLGITLSVSSGELAIPAYNLQVILDGRNITGGLSAEPPHAEVETKLLFATVKPFVKSMMLGEDVYISKPGMRTISRGLINELKLSEVKPHLSNVRMGPVTISQIEKGAVAYIRRDLGSAFDIDEEVLDFSRLGVKFKTKYEFVKEDTIIDRGQEVRVSIDTEKINLESVVYG